MAIKYIETSGLTYIFQKIFALVANYAKKDLSNVSNSDIASKVAAAGAGIPTVTTEGTGAAYTATVPGITALSTGLTITIIPHTVSTQTSPTLNVNGLGAKSIRQLLGGGSASTVAGASTSWLAANKPVTVQYDGAQWRVDFTRADASSLYGTVAVAKGGTGGTSASTARANLGAEAKHSTVAASLTTAGWDSTNKTQTINVTGVTADNTVLVAPDPSSQEAWGKAQVVCTAQAAGKLTFTCKNVPTAAVTANIVILGG